jgi:methyl-accepting chemotaxis protein
VLGDSFSPNDQGRPSVSDLVEQVGRDGAMLAFREAQLTAAHHRRQLRRATREVAAGVVVLVALIVAFVFGTWAAADALSTALSGWRAPLVLAVAWLVIGSGALALLLRGRLARRPVAAVGAADPIRRREQAVEEAEEKMRQTLDRLSGAIASAAEERIAAAILPLAGGMVETGEEMVEATDEVIEAADEITDVLEEQVPGGMVVNRAVDIALAPGRFGVRVARTALKLGQPDS